MFLTQTTAPVIRQVAILLGWIMNGIFSVQSAIGWANIGLCIILFTIVVYMIMTPLTYQQQKFSRMSAKMNPEIQAVQKKYQNKKNDPAAMQKMNDETQAIYAKYGVNPMGSCLQLAVQMPILFALYRVIWNIPAYVGRVKDVFTPLAEALMKTSGAETYLAETAKSLNVNTFSGDMNVTKIIDVLYKFKPDTWTELAKKFPELTDNIDKTQHTVDKMNYFIGLNIADTPMNIITTAAKSGAILLLIGGVLIPLLAALTQWLNAKLMSSMNPAQQGGQGQVADTMANSMKTMNTVMPLMSAFFCLTLPVGLGIYWIIGAVVRCIQQIVINKRLEKTPIEELIAKNIEKMNKKREKKGLAPQKMVSNATISARNIAADAEKPVKMVQKENPKADLMKKASTISENAGKKAGNAKAGSLAARAGMVQDFNDKHAKKK